MNAPLYTVIDEAERDKSLSQDGYNAPHFSPTYTSNEFADEWDDVRTRIKSALEAHWTCGIDVDFYMDWDTPEDRIVFVEVSNERMLDQRLVPLVYTAVCDLKSDYMVALCNSMVYLETADGERYPDFNLFITRHGVRVYSQSDKLFQRLGINVKQR